MLENKKTDERQGYLPYGAISILTPLWIFVSLFFTPRILNSFSLDPIPLNDPSCSLSTIAECNEKAIEEAKRIIRDTLPRALEKLETTRDTFPLLKLIPTNYELSILNKGSEFQLKISDPPKSFSFGKVDLECQTTSRSIFLSNQSRIRLTGVAYSGNIQKDIDRTLKVIDEFQGCIFLPTYQRYKFPHDTLAAPGATLTSNIVMKPVLEFTVDYRVTILLFFGIFALVGTFLALVKQFINIARKGFLYFCET